MSDLNVKLEGKDKENYINQRNANRSLIMSNLTAVQPERLGLIRRVGEVEFVDDLLSDDYANWTYDEAKTLFEYYDELSDCFENGLEIDRTMVRCEWSSYKSFNDILEAYGLDSIQELEDRTTMIQLEDSILIQDF